jgi:hypothetical protein
VEVPNVSAISHGIFLARANAEEIAQSMLELGGMAGGAAEVRGGLADADAGLQAVGAQYGQRLAELQELRATQANMAATRQVPDLLGEACSQLIGDNGLPGCFTVARG